ncbi:hypothetical protein UFOVP41_16 [uncultured Caudovirales phage]|uniref:Large polyvalent protein associated domain-containing protein n=1 Tax=uncultured Caudovirales phage TaxID=2100421 RepID=A0A6J5KPQ0_9CAUD|nr:hypothetical protein UFOVP41_16 [uncultured Caudovirales phage]
MANQEPSLKQALYDILNGLQSEKNLRETKEGLIRLREAAPGVAESVARGAIASVPGSVGDISEFARTVAPETMESTFGRRVAPTTREILDYVPRMTPTHEGATTLEDVGAAIAPGVGGVAKDLAKLTEGRSLGLMMIGPESKLWKPEMAFNAGKMESKGKTPEEIWKTTGMVRGLDGQWRQEISDLWANLRDEKIGGSKTFGELHQAAKDKYSKEQSYVGLKDILSHDDLEKAYPGMFIKGGGDIDIRTHEGPLSDKGSYKQSIGAISINKDLPVEQAKSTLLHELQHVIQGKEGWNRGANYAQQVRHYVGEQEKLMGKIEDINGQMKEALNADDIEKYRQLMVSRDVLSRRYMDIDPEKMGYSDYLHHGGEAEARLVQRRMNLGEQGRETHFPYEYTGERGYGLDIHPDEAIITTKHPSAINTQEYEYRGVHTAPYRTDDGTTAPAHEMNRTYPDDIYSPEGHRYYGHGGNDTKMDKETMAILQAAKGNPDHPITIYRSVPKEFAGEDIYNGDWVTPNIEYAKMHGRRWDDGYHIIEKTVPAKHIWTEGNSIHEFGYDPHE